ncbi:glycoside hydrolase family 76 protein [Gracilibacillus alcaliphilus]|uniref:glycoside hydrolase family 76 protein n=1 Tax=Gracilibacillus alcaliphilus TaxID=1401441 RepID=UPI00195C079B|nr:glycoside hydrolase family 76 protein [Gracilibacillus alcaliphilus]MBM7676975.1 putative alpha-1,6-mannanase (GH76 family) [Gracilibacillus alcaliphilus]
MNRTKKWSSRAQEAFDSLKRNYWNDQLKMFNNHYPNPDNYSNLTFHYWWYAHAIDSLIDAYHRSKDETITVFIEKEYRGLIFRNGGQPRNLLYDDMEWLALALLRAYQITKDNTYLTDVRCLWEDIKTGWNDHMDGGIAWHKNQLDYKNTPANGPAIILAARLYQCFGDKADLEWAKKIFVWLDEYLIDAATGFVMDGINRLGDGQIDADWEFTYCQGVYVGGAVELYRITNKDIYLEKALQTAHTAIDKLHDQEHDVLQSEGNGDGGLFKGIMVRYFTELITAAPSRTAVIRDYLEKNAETIWQHGTDKEKIIFHHLWSERPDLEAGVDLSIQLSGVILLECLAMLEQEGIVTS